MNTQVPQDTDVHSLIAGRLIADPNFVTSLMQNPRQALNDALVNGNVTPDDMLINDLVAELEAFEGTHGFNQLVTAAQGYMTKGEKAEMV
jgi:hypothetical protein